MSYDNAFHQHQFECKAGCGWHSHPMPKGFETEKQQAASHVRLKGHATRQVA